MYQRVGAIACFVFIVTNDCIVDDLFKCLSSQFFCRVKPIVRESGSVGMATAYIVHTGNIICVAKYLRSRDLFSECINNGKMP